MDLHRLDLADTAALRDAYRVESAATAHARPGWSPMAEQARLLAWRADDGWDRTLVAAREDGRLVGVAACLTGHDTPDTSWITVSVLPERQGRGTGGALVRAAEEAAPDTAERFVASAYRRTTEDVERLVRRFAEPLGYHLATTETVVELDLTAADVAVAAPPAGYTVVTHVDGVPEPLRREVGVLRGLVDAEAPSGSLEWQPTPVPPEEYAAELALWREQGRTAVETLAVSDAGEVVAWTCVVTAADASRPADIEGTMVLATHRGRRLGLAVKSANLLAVRDHGRTDRVRTSSDDANVWMRAINEQLGFVPVESEVVLSRTRGKVRAGS